MIDSKGPKTFARSVGILEMRDGSLLFSEDGNGRLYRIEYLQKQSKIMLMISVARTIRIDMTLFIVLVFWKSLFEILFSS
jgi:hypothetical protein